MPTFPSNTNSIPNNLGKPNPPIILRRNAGRTPEHRTRHNPPRKAVRKPPRRGWRRAMRAPGRDTGHTTRHTQNPPLPAPTPPPQHTPKNARGRRPGMGGRGGARPRGGRGRGRRGYSRRPLLPLQPQKTNQGGQQVQDLIGIGHRPKNHQPKSFERQCPPTALFGRSLDRRYRHRLDPPHEPPTAVIRTLRTLRAGNLYNPFSYPIPIGHLGCLH